VNTNSTYSDDHHYATDVGAEVGSLVRPDVGPDVGPLVGAYRWTRGRNTCRT
jgi:hypothetical protein